MIKTQGSLPWFPEGLPSRHKPDPNLLSFSIVWLLEVSQINSCSEVFYEIILSCPQQSQIYDLCISPYHLYVVNL